MGSSSIDAYVRDAVVEQARGVLAERFGTDIPTADKILVDVARAQRRSLVDLAGAVIESCANDSTPLSQRLYTNASGISDAA